MIANEPAVLQLRDLVEVISRLCYDNNWPIALLCGYRDSKEIGACASVWINPTDPDVQQMIVEKSAIGNPMIATAFTYQQERSK